MNHSIKHIDLRNLLINTENYRFEMVGNQREAIQVMIENLEDKLYKLAQHIVKHGLNPSDRIIVSPESTDKKLFNVLEGNRRIIVLKLLDNPNLIDSRFSSFANKIKKLSDEYKKNPINNIECVVFDDPDDANEWIRLKHSGQSEGAGTVEWDAQQIGRFDEKVEGKSPIAIQALDFLKNSKCVDSNLKNQLNKVPSSSLARLLGDPDVRDFVGLSLQNGILQSEVELEEVVKGLSQMVVDLLDPKFKVSKIYNKTDRLDYLRKFKKVSIPDKKKKQGSPWELTSPNSNKTGTVNAKKKKAPISTDRKTIIPKDFSITVKERRLNKIYYELRSLNVDQYENAVAVLLRVFIELSLDTFIHENKIPKLTKDKTLRQKAEGIANHFEQNGILDNHQLKGIRTCVSNTNSVLSIDTFNSFVHNRHLSPIPKDLKTTWDNIQIFVEKLWEHIK